MAKYPFRPQAVSADEAGGYRASVLATLLLLSLPFTQFGLTYWISVQGIVFWVVALFVLKSVTRLQLLLFTLMCLCMLVSLAGHLYADSLFYSFLRSIRQMLALYLIVCAAGTRSWRPRGYFFDVALPLVIVGVSGLVILQFVTYTFFGSSIFFVPGQVFIQGFATIADRYIELGAARGFIAEVRAAGPYAEPSYFGFVALSLALLVVRGVESGLRQALLLGLMFVALLCSKSASGVVSLGLFVLFAYRKRLAFHHFLFAFAAVTVALVASEAFLNFNLIERLMNITDPVKEPSGYVRLVLPFKHIALVLQEKPFGVPLSEFFVFTSRHLDHYVGSGTSGPVSLIEGASSGTDNGLLNLVIAFGIGGIVLLALAPFVIRDKLVLVYLLFASQFNGDVFSPDKAAIIALAISTWRIRPSDAARVEAAVRHFTPRGPFGGMFPVRA